VRVAKFNELSRFSLHQVATEQRRMNHFEQGLMGNIRSTTAGQTFESFQDMYQWAVKIARVQEESENENQAINMGKRKLEFNRGGFRGRNFKQFRPGQLQGKGKQPMGWPDRPLCRFYS